MMFSKFFNKDGKKKPESPESKLEEAAAYFQKGDGHLKRRAFAEAEERYLKCLSVLEPLSRQSESTRILRELSRTYSMLSVTGLAVTDKKKRREATEWAKKSVEIDEKLAEKEGTAKAYDNLATSYANLAAATGDLILCDKALQIWFGRDAEAVPL